jgi:hypothetical protein
MKSQDRPLRRILTAMSYGELSYVGSALIGFVAGNVMFLLLYMVDSNPGESSGYADQLPTLAAILIGSVVAMSGLAALFNYVVGRQIMEEIALQRRAHPASDSPVAPRADAAERGAAVADTFGAEEERQREMA